MFEKCFCNSGIDLENCCFKRYPSIAMKADLDNMATCTKYDLWSLERRWVCISLTKMFAEYCNLENQNIIIFGAGTCMDLPMDFICEKFSDIVLVDINESALEKSKEYIPSEHFNKVSWINWDVTGLMEGNIRGYIDDLKSGKFKDIHQALSFFIELSKDDIELILPEEIKAKMPFAVTISDLMVTQMFTPTYNIEIYPELRKLDSIRANNALDINEINNFIDFMNLQHMKLLYKVTKKEIGKVLVLTDTFIAGREFDGTISDFTSVIQKNPNLLIQNNISVENIKEWIGKYSIGGSNIIYPLKKYEFQKFSLEKQMWWWWHFSMEKMYLVLSFLLTPCDKDVEL